MADAMGAGPTKKYQKADVRMVVREAEKSLEKARRMMVDSEGNFTSEEVHEVAMAQFAVSKAKEKLEPRR